jgi:hypothetical protein
VAAGEARSRIIITVNHTNEQIDALVGAFKKLKDATPMEEDFKNGTNKFADMTHQEAYMKAGVTPTGRL